MAMTADELDCLSVRPSLDSFCFPKSSKFFARRRRDEGITLIGLILGRSPIRTLWFDREASRKLRSLDRLLTWDKSGLFLGLLTTCGMRSSLNRML